MIRACTCSHAYQDSVFGRGMRYMNPTKKVGNVTQPGLRCTVCGKVQAK